MRRWWLLICLPLILGACGSGDGELKVDEVRANLTLPTETGAVYMTISNETGEDETLVGATIPGCSAVELHEVIMEGEVMVMQQVEGGEIAIPAGETVELKQGGLHLMCLGKTGEFAVGDTVPVRLEFARAGMMEVAAEVIEPGGMEMDQ